jgi:hypothetical protein
MLSQALASQAGAGGTGPLAGALPWSFFGRLALDVICVAALIRGVYFRNYRRADLFLTFFSFNLCIFLLTFLLNGVQMSLGAAFGLFAVFSILRYRTEGMSVNDMTYLFLVIALGLLMAVSGVGWIGLAVIGAAMVLCTALLESNVLGRREQARAVRYDRIELLGRDRRQELIADLAQRTGLEIKRVDVRDIDLLRDCAHLTVYYTDGRDRR